MSAAAAVLWWISGESPASEVPIDEEISPVIGAGPEPEVVGEQAPPTVVWAPPEPTPQVEAARPSPAPRTKRHVAKSWQPPPPQIVAQLSLVRISDVPDAQSAEFREQVGRRLEAMRACSEGVMRRSPATIRGTIVARVTVRDGRVSATVVDSASRDAALRWCFRGALMGMPLSPAAGGAGFDARLEFFLLPRTLRSSPNQTP